MSGLTVETSSYRLELRADGLLARVAGPDGDLLADLRPLAAVDTTAGPDETLAVAAPQRLEGEAPAFRIERRSTVWEWAGLDLVCGEDAVELVAWVDLRPAGTSTIIAAPPTATGIIGNRIDATAKALRSSSSPSPAAASTTTRNASFTTNSDAMITATSARPTAMAAGRFRPARPG